MLLPLIDWAVRHRDRTVEQGSWAALDFVKPPPKKLAERVKQAIQLYPCDILFIHRDAEKAHPDHRLSEIRTAMKDLDDRYVPVIPIRMTEAWFLHDEPAIRQASGNPQGSVALSLPKIHQVERISDPKEVLFEALLEATEASGHLKQKRKRDQPRMRMRVAELIDDFGALEGKVPAFDRFLGELDVALKSLPP